ncbi:MSHA biogenesis protein MshP [Aeromonas caviae]|uniref:MSHA biogenesis protein MshP n=1 Tax=Aeromonas caviae TaxID=648 RepID=UPI001F1AFF45|nr:MSHA biogenesis protein MshP [Aeromonas caviae]MDH0027217.1 MSHA biogenesis protein MshP [Aeromonas caviae]MDH0238929.1 MSHA biogenesis protein MshP [Aeromonas caviae]MDH1078988.1 MSHA biogenesis protein MshP [Aeromonas caviae]
MSPDARPLPPGTQRGSAIMIALFVIVIMALLAAAMGRFLVDSGEKHGVEVRGVRALMAAQSGLEIALYRLYPNDEWTAQRCDASTTTAFALPGLADCEAEVSCQQITVSAAGGTQTGYRFRSEGRCGDPRQSGPSPDFAVSRTLVAEAFDGTTP